MANQAKKKSPKNQWSELASGVFGLAMAYGFGSWAIDTGSLWLYLFSFVSLYFALDYLRKFMKGTFLKTYDKPKSKNQRTKKA